MPALNHQFAGIRVAAVVRAQGFPDNTVRMVFQDSIFKAFNDKFDQDMWKSSDGGNAGDSAVWGHLDHHMAQESVPVPEAIKAHLEAPFKVIIVNGHVKAIQCEVTEPEYITNIKKAAVSHLTTLHMTDLVKVGEDEFVPEHTAMETTIVGECETHHTITKMTDLLAKEFEEREQLPHQELCQGKPYYQVIKAKDMKNCKERPIYMEMTGASAVSDGSLGATAPFAMEDSVTHTIICGSPSEYYIRKVHNHHTFITSPTGKFDTKEKLQVAGKSLLLLHSVMPKTTNIPDVVTPKPAASLMFEFPAETSVDSVVSYKSSMASVGSEDADNWYKPQVGLPDMVSAPHTFHTTHLDLQQEKANMVKVFLHIMATAEKSPESSHEGEDTAGSTTVLLRTMAKLSLTDLKAVWGHIDSKLAMEVKEHHQHAWLDLLATCGTNPCIAYVIEAVKSNMVTGEAAAWILTNAVRSVKTPTQHVLTELTALLKHPTIQSDRHLSATLALSLTHLVHMACIDKTTSVYNFPVKMYGKFCDEKSAIITQDLIPFLATKLFTTPETDSHHILTYINALGNLGHDAAAIHLIKFIEAKAQPTMDSLPRSIAVYQLIKTAMAKPHLYTPVLLSIIENVAECAEVRMAAITVLPYTQPSSHIMNKLAVATWWEPSTQVTSYIHSTLKTIASLPYHSTLYSAVGEKAKAALLLAKPAQTGIQTSHNIMITEFLHTLKAAVNVKLQYVTSKESAFPKVAFYKTVVKSEAHKTNNLEASVYFQGAEYLINKMYETYNSLLPTAEIVNLGDHKDYISNIINVKSRKMKEPKAHITVKMMGLQRLLSIDNTMVESIIEEITKEAMDALSKNHSLTKDFMKIIDVNGHKAIIPTESGLPIHFHHTNPLVVFGKASLSVSLTDMSHGAAELTVKPVINYNQMMTAHVFCPFTNKYLGAGVDTSVHATMPLTTELSMVDGHYTITIKTPTDMDSQRERPVVAFNVKPYTTIYDMSSTTTVANYVGTKVIKTGIPLTTKEFNVGHHFGLSLILKVSTEQPFADIAEFLGGLKHHSPLTLLALPLPLNTIREHNVQLIYNPVASTTKAASLSLSYALSKKLASAATPLITSSTFISVPAAIQTKCSSSSGTAEEMLECHMRETVAAEKVACLTGHSTHSRPTSEAESICSKKSVMTEQRWVSHYENSKMASWISRNFQKDAWQGATINLLATLYGENYLVDRKIQTQLTIGEEKPITSTEEGVVKMDLAIRTPASKKPYKVELESTYLVRRPIHMWDINAMLEEVLTSKVNAVLKYGWMHSRKEHFQFVLTADRSAELKTFVKNSEAFKTCMNHFHTGLKLTETCQAARTLTSILDTLTMDLSVPNMVTTHPYVETTLGMLKAFLLPYMTLGSTTYNRKSATHQHYVIEAKTSPTGKVLSLAVSGNKEKTMFTNIRLHKMLVHMLPICVMDNTIVHSIKEATMYGAPSVCSIEGSTVSTFDQLAYEYTLNTCEHVLFRDCSANPKVMVTAKKTPAMHHIKAIIDHNKYEIELVKGGRTITGKIIVNGLHTGIHKVIGHTGVLDDGHNKITLYQDGAYEIFSLKYGMAIVVDITAVQVKTYQWALRNLACGLCGDLNDEKTGDMKSAGECIMSTPQLAAYSYMVQDTTCPGIPTTHAAIYAKETTECLKQKVIHTKVEDVFKHIQHQLKSSDAIMKHLVVDVDQKVCVSKEQVKVCGSRSHSAEFIRKEMDFFCVAKDQEGETLRRIAHSGARIEQAHSYSTDSLRTVYEAKAC